MQPARRAGAAGLPRQALMCELRPARGQCADVAAVAAVGPGTGAEVVPPPLTATHAAEAAGSGSCASAVGSARLGPAGGCPGAGCCGVGASGARPCPLKPLGADRQPQ